MQAQFVITPEGLSTEDGKDYIIITAEGKDKNTLYQEALKCLTKTYVSAKDVLSTVEGEMIAVNGIYTLQHFVAVYDICYTLNMEFRDGRVKYSLPVINSMNGVDEKGREYQLTYNISNGGLGAVCLVGIYNKKGELKREWIKKSIESFFNNNFRTLQTYLTKTEDDW